MAKRDSTLLPDDLRAALEGLAARDGSAREAALATVVRGAQQLARKERQALGDALVELLEAPDGHTRSFATVPLAYLASVMVWRRSWTPRFLDWWVQEPDQRGFVAEIGWVHAVAHGADVLGELGQTSTVPAGVLLDAVARRLAHPSSTVWRDQEEDRLALAVAQVLLQDDLGASDATGWIRQLSDRMATGEAPIPATTINTCRTMRSLYVVVDGEVPAERARAVKHAGRVQEEIRRLLVVVEPWLAASR
ncbi:DUF2785 domain-containing protein [Arsenicicoccus dermatophilus]|uniref:DUF2785 domain-containing protein n=1 Tax=Arsenicicoccus dermatophilus TaxID=1076331 RepID=UPI001F4CD440|nr:DUF2785 domain-containing protein [Arsenicicoccus dermatophilus]MCH8613784.1 DUF2785 domain-containing protein [Arsenicicoccus dermatophilus]